MMGGSWTYVMVAQDVAIEGGKQHMAKLEAYLGQMLC